MTMANRVFYTGLVSVALALGGCCKVPAGGTGGSSAQAAPKGPATPVDLTKMLAEYKDNEVRADNQFKGKYVQISGVANNITKDFTDSLVVTIGTGKQLEFEHVNCSFADDQKDQAAALSKGQRVTVKGTVGGLIIGTVAMRGCQFAQ
jgi:hypothetical protein